MSDPDRQQTQAIRPSLIVEAASRNSAPIVFTVDGQSIQAWTGQSVLAAVLLNRNMLRQNEFSGEARAGFCMMGACQDCWMWLDNGGRIRACTTPLIDGMAVRTRAPEGFPGHG
jgi:predicted molibdopterin-dependent oxidoreductase YjgC